MLPTKTATLAEHHAALLQLLDEFDRVCKQLDIPYVLFAGSMLGAVRHKGFIPWDDDLDVMLLRSDYERLLKKGPTVLNKQFFLQKEFSPHWPVHFSKLRLNGTTCLEKYYPRDPAIHQGVYIDIFPCDNASNTGFVRKLQFIASKIVIAKVLDHRGYLTDNIIKKIFMFLCRPLPMKPFLDFARGKDSGTAYVHCFFGAGSKYEHCVFPRSYLEERITLPFEGRMAPVSAHYDALLRLLYGDYMRIPSEAERVCKKHAILVDLKHPYTDFLHYRDNMTFDCYSRSIR